MGRRDIDCRENRASEEHSDYRLRDIGLQKKERTALQHVVENGGHVLLLCPSSTGRSLKGEGSIILRGSPNSKFRQEINDEIPLLLHQKYGSIDVHESKMCVKIPVCAA